jgi:polysaccharide transporter, PST family
MTSVRRVLRAIRHPVSQNALAMQATQGAILLVPLVTLPYTSRVLGSDGFGLVAFAQSLSFTLAVVVQWGFEPWASREVAVAREDRERITALAAQITGARLILSVGALAVAAVVYITAKTTKGSPEFVAMAWLAAASTGLNPMWFFLGHERVRLTAVVVFALRVAAAVLTFVLVHDRGDAWIVMALFTGAAVLIAAINTMRMFRRIEIRRPRLGPSSRAIRDSAALFAGTAGRSLYTAMNVVLLGFFASRTEVAHYSAAEKVIRACGALLIPVGVVMYPRVTHLYWAGRSRRALRLLLTGGAALLSVASVLAAVAMVFAPPLMGFIYGAEFGAGAELLRIQAPILPITMVSLVAALWLLVRRKDSSVMRITLAAGAVNLALAPALVHVAGTPGMAWSVLCAEITAMTLALAITVRGHRRRAGGDQVAGEGSGEAARA